MACTQPAYGTRTLPLRVWYLALVVLAVLSRAVDVRGAANVTLDVAYKASGGKEWSKNLFGVFFEEINHAGEGGLYAEQVQDRSFDYTARLFPPNVTQNGFSLQPMGDNPHGKLFLRHCGFEGYVTTISTETDREDSTFRMVPALNGKSFAVSFEAFNYEGYYLRPQSLLANRTYTPGMLPPRDFREGRLVLDPFVNNSAFLDSASFMLRPGLANSSEPYQSFVVSGSGPFAGMYITLELECTGACARHWPSSNCFNVVVRNASNIQDPKLATFAVLRGNVYPRGPWTSYGPAVQANIGDKHPLNSKNKNYLVLQTSVPLTGVINSGFWGIYVADGMQFQLSLFAALDPEDEGQNNTVVGVSLMAPDFSQLYASATFDNLTNAWQKFTVNLTVKATAPNSQALLAVVLKNPTVVHLDVISLFPLENVELGHPFRLDLLEKLQALKPSFIRLPGGHYVEGVMLKDAFIWSNTIGPIEERPGHMNDVWGYWSTDGLGFYEYLLLAEVLQADVVWVINAGISYDQSVPPSNIQPWVDSAVNSIEFALGAVTTKWGAMRANMGHPAPFNLSYIAIGNEDCAKPFYANNYLAFYENINRAYPHVKVIANCDVKDQAPIHLYDLHIYSSMQYFVDNVQYFDNMSRSGPRVFNSEYAVTTGGGNGNLGAALGEAAWMTGLERNSDLVPMASYATLFVNSNNRKWTPDAIVFDSMRLASHTYGTPSYYVQQMFSLHRGEEGLAYALSLADSEPVAVSVACNANCTQFVLKLVNTNPGPATTHLTVLISGLPSNRNLSTSVQWITLTSAHLTDENSFSSPTAIVPRASTITIAPQRRSATQVVFNVTVLPISFNILTLALSGGNATNSFSAAGGVTSGDDTFDIEEGSVGMSH